MKCYTAVRRVYMIDEKLFCMIMKELKNIHEFENSICDTWKLFYGEIPDPMMFPCDCLEECIVSILENYFDDHTDDFYGSIISWWIYGVHFGEEIDPDDDTCDEELRCLNTSQDLYNYLSKKLLTGLVSKVKPAVETKYTLS